MSLPDMSHGLTDRTKSDVNLKTHNQTFDFRRHQSRGNESSQDFETEQDAAKFEQNNEDEVDNLDMLSNAGGKKGQTTVMQTYFNMFKCFIGIGILATPAALKNVGVVGGAVGIFLCGSLNLYTMKLQIACKEKVGHHVTSYSELGFEVFGPLGK